MKRSIFLGLMTILALTAGYILRVTWHDDFVILSWMGGIGAALVGLCYAVDRSRLGPLDRNIGHRVIDWGYWMGFVVVIFCLFHGATPANASAVSPPSSQPQVPASRPSSVLASPILPSPVMLKGNHFVPAGR